MFNDFFVLKNNFSNYFSGGSSRVEEAIECYQRAANMFKMAKKWGSAGNAFCEAATLYSKLGSRHDAATNYVDAANCYKKSDPNGMIILNAYLKFKQLSCIAYYMFCSLTV